jgi:hypothetical protein
MLTAACSKEKKIEKNLSSKDGTWNVASYTVVNYEDDVQVNTLTASNVGTMVFKSDGTGTSSFNYMGLVQNSTFTWTNTEEKLTINDNGDIVVFDITKQDKSILEIEGADTYEEGGINYRDEIKMTLEKK